MPLNLISSFIVALFLTLLIEIFIAFILGYKDKTSIAIIALINIITNPLLNYLIIINNQLNLIKYNLIFLLVLEISIIFIEWGILVYSIKSKNSKQLFVLSLIMNFTSFIIGLLLFGY